jgi:tripartite-type tricarboxylate transporter receptor subunit TctC
MKQLRILAALCCLALSSAGNAADAYPSKVIRLISQFPAGGGTDVLGRVVAPMLSEMLGQPVIVENRAGAGGNIGADYVAKSPPDGYTILVANNVIVTNPAIQKTPFNVEKDFAPIAMVGATPIVIAVHPSVPANDVKELIALVKASPGKYAYASCGNGTAQHLAGELLKQKTGIDMVHASYKGCSPAVIDGVAGVVPILISTMNNVLPHSKAGKLKILAVASASKSSSEPTIPSIAEAGITGFDAEIWYGFLAPAKTPPEIVTKLNAAFRKILQIPDVQQKLSALSFNVKVSTPDEFSTVIQRDLAKWSKLVKDANIEIAQ